VTCDHRIGDRVRMALVGIAGFTDPAAQLDARALLDDVRSLVGGGVQIG
jgi:hypothetical protein